MLNLGIIGMNEGNGHPYSYSALFNGYNPIELEKNCPFSLIKDYLPKQHKNENFIKGAKVTHIWTQDLNVSKNIAKVSLIENVVPKIENLIGEVDAVILARDDPWNHLEMAKPFIQKGLPIFIDKQLTSTKEDLNEFMELVDEKYPLMAGSSMRFTKEVIDFKKNIEIGNIKSIHGMSRVSWLRYGHHLFEGIAVIFGLDINWVRSLCSDEHHDIIQIRYNNKLNVILEFVDDVHLPIEFKCFSSNHPPISVPFTDFFNSFKRMMESFVDMINTKNNPIAYTEIVSIAKVILAGEISKKRDGIKINPVSLLPY